MIQQHDEHPDLQGSRTAMIGAARRAADTARQHPQPEGRDQRPCPAPRHRQRGYAGHFRQYRPHGAQSDKARWSNGQDCS